MHGHIWRVTTKGRPLLKPPKIVGSSIEELLSLIAVEEEWTRLHPKLELRRHGAALVRKPLSQWLEKLDAQAKDYDRRRLEALWLLQALRDVNQPLLEDLLRCGDHRVRAAAIHALARRDAPAARWKLTPELLAALTAEVEANGDARRGERIYRREELQCMKCHALGGAGGRVGPDMASIGGSAQVDYLIESLLDPHKKVKENFHSLTVVTENGRVLNGLPVRQTKEVLVLRDAEDREITLSTGSIIEQKPGRSLMPDGTVDSLTQSELADLVKFLSSLGKGSEFSIGKERVARRWRKLIWTPQAHRRLNRTSFDTAAGDDGALTWAPAYSQVNGGLPVQGLPPYKVHDNLAPTSFVYCEAEVTTPGMVALQFSSIEGLSLWIDGKPTPISPQLQIPLERGLHRFTLAVNQEQRTAPMRIELRDVAGSPAQARFVGGK